jgi:protein-S-isoprenylcysteine O-methyltransferase Ste14
VKHPFRRKNLSPRLLPLYAAGLAFFWLASPTRAGLAAGLVLVTAGLSLRVWGAGHLVKNDELTVSGPYAYVRHPLYAGSLLLALGIGAIAGGSAFALALLAITPLFIGYYLPYKERVESARLERHYGAAYASYRAAVPLLVPGRTAWHAPAESTLEGGTESTGEGGTRWSPGRFRDNDEAGTVVGIAVAVLVLALRPYLAP